jgi:hypothetical protein
MRYILITILFLCTGCTTLTFTSPTGAQATYSRFGSQSLDGVEIVLSDGTGLSFDKQKADPSKFIEALTEFLKQIPK